MNSELYHHGIPGQKWGVRRFQNLDRTWTAAGKERYGRDAQKKKREEAQKSIRKSKASASTESSNTKKSIKSGDKKNNFWENVYQKNTKKQLSKQFNIDEETLRNTDARQLWKDANSGKYKPKHEVNDNSELKRFVASVAMDTFVPGMQVYLPIDLYRGGKAAVGHVRSKKYEEERNNNPIDKATGFHVKTKNLSEEEDLKRVNPDFNDFNSNSKSNCVLCTMTYEMRRRGYDVTANKAGVGYFDDEIKSMFKNYKVEHIGDQKSFNEAKKAGKASGSYVRNLVNKIESTQPEGSRGNLSVMWGALYGGGGHSMSYEIKNGKMVIYDGQSGKIYSNPEKVLRSCSSVDIGRLDNLAFDKKGIKECCR